MIKLIFLTLILSVNAQNFKKNRTNKISPLSDTIIEIENIKKQNKNKFTTMSIKTSALKTFNNNSKNKKWKIKLNSYGIPKLISGDTTIKRYYGTNENIFNTFVNENKDILGIDINNIKKITESEFLGTRHIMYQQYYKGIAVEFSSIKLHITKNSEISQYNARYFPDINIDINPTITIENAKSILISDLGYPINISTYTLVIYPDELNEKYYLSYKINVSGGSGFKNGNWIYYIDAKNGNILFKYDTRQYACSLQEETTGTVKGYVYEISPIPTGTDKVSKIIQPIENQYVYAGGISKSTVTKPDGEYCIDYDNANGAKVFMTLSGPYFSVMNFNGNPSYFTNGNYTWRTVSTPLNVTSYNSNSQNIYTITPSFTINSGEALAFVGPIFSNFNIGKLDNCGTALDNDMVYVLDSSQTAIASWFGQSKTNLFGGLVPDTSYKIKIKSDDSNSGSFNIVNSSYMVITNAQNKNNATGSIIWSTSNYLTDPYGASINTFYHLNKVRNFMMKFNSKCGGIGCANLDKKVPVMIDVFGDQTTFNCTEPDTMWNAFYDLEHDGIFVGKGIYGKDFGLDGTVIRHEYGHLVMNRIYPIIYFGEFGAISEAVADYFSLSSFWDEGETLTVLGNYLNAGIGEGSSRDLKSYSDNPKKMPDDWVGEVHDDSRILSGALYKIRKDPTYQLGQFTSGTYSGLYKADLYLFGAMFYFPDNFENFLEAVVDVCKRIEGLGCQEQKIRNAFAIHGIGSQNTIDPYEPNNGPEYATDISSFSTVYGYIDYRGDEDYYIIPLKEGTFQARLYLPEAKSFSTGSGYYHAFSLFLFDSNRNYIKDVSPTPIYSFCYSDSIPDNCYTKESYVDLTYTVPKSNIYYLAVTGSLNQYYGNGIDYNNIKPYILTYLAQSTSIVDVQIKNRKVDEDEIEFSVKVPKFEYLSDLTHSNWTNGSEFEFCEYDCIKILDNNLMELSTNYISISYATGETSYNTIDSIGNPVIKGKITFKSYNGKTFSQRYPAVGTIYLKIFAKNHMYDIKNSLITLGISNPINLTANSDNLITYNNIITPTNSNMIIKYEATKPTNIKICVYTATGHLVKKIYEGPILGKVSFNWDGTDDNGNKLASGIYYIKAEGGVNKVEKVGIVR